MPSSFCLFPGFYQGDVKLVQLFLGDLAGGARAVETCAPLRPPDGGHPFRCVSSGFPHRKRCAYFAAGAPNDGRGQCFSSVTRAM